MYTYNKNNNNLFFQDYKLRIQIEELKELQNKAHSHIITIKLSTKFCRNDTLSKHRIVSLTLCEHLVPLVKQQASSEHARAGAESRDHRRGNEIPRAVDQSETVSMRVSNTPQTVLESIEEGTKFRVDED